MIRASWKHTVLAAAIAAAPMAGVSTASAEPWNERTILTFSEPVMVPGATLQAGTYVFRIADMGSNRHVVRITTDQGSEPVAVVQAIPVMRTEVSGEIVLRFNPTDTGHPPALKAWFYPASRYGHQFVYSEEQARQIAERTKSVVLATDAPGADAKQGRLYSFNEAGLRADWTDDEPTLAEWRAWVKTRGAAAGSEASSAAMMSADRQAMAVSISDLEEKARQYVGQTVSVDAEVQDILGPRLFTIDEPHWGDLDGEILVYVPTALAAFVRDNDRVTVTGTVKTFVEADVEREWGWLGLPDEVEVQYERKPMIVATRIVGGDNNRVLLVTAPVEAPASGNGGGEVPHERTLTDAAVLMRGQEAHVGRFVDLDGLPVATVAEDGGYFVKAGDRRIFVLPADRGNDLGVAPGDTLDIEGVVLHMPADMARRLSIPAGADDGIYVYATGLEK